MSLISSSADNSKADDLVPGRLSHTQQPTLLLYSSCERDCFAIAVWTLLANTPLATICVHGGQQHFFSTTFRWMAAAGVADLVRMPHYSRSLKCGVTSEAVEARYAAALDRFQVSVHSVQGGVGSPLLEALLAAEAQLVVLPLWEVSVGQRFPRIIWYQRLLQPNATSLSAHFVPYRHGSSGDYADVCLVECETPPLERLAQEHSGPPVFSAMMMYVGSLVAVRKRDREGSDHEVVMLPAHPASETCRKVICDNDQMRILMEFAVEYELCHLTDVWCRRSLLL